MFQVFQHIHRNKLNQIRNFDDKFQLQKSPVEMWMQLYNS